MCRQPAHRGGGRSNLINIKLDTMILFEWFSKLAKELIPRHPVFWLPTEGAALPLLFKLKMGLEQRHERENELTLWKGRAGTGA